MAVRGCLLAGLTRLGCGMKLSVSDIPEGSAPPALPEPRARAADYTPLAPAPQRAASTPEPTLAPGVACACLPGSCFAAYDRDGDGCLSAQECALQSPLGVANCTSPAWDQDGNGCIDQADEWPRIFDMYSGEVCPVEPAPLDVVECQTGYFLKSQGSCERCDSGATRRRRAFECSACPAGTFDAGDFDDCLCGLYTSQEHRAGTTKLRVSSADGLHVDDRLIITGHSGAACANESAPGCNGTQWESVLVSEIAGNEVTIGYPLRHSYQKYSNVRIQCTITDGSDLSHKYRTSYCGGEVKSCGCGAVECDHTTKCDLTDPAAPNGRCAALDRYPAFPTPAPTVGAKGDPHLVNLAGEHFDINHGGTFLLLRLPQALNETADVEINAVVRPEWGKPCVTYITQVELSGRWLGGMRVQVRCFLREHAETNETEEGQDGQFLGIRTLREGDAEDAVPWINMTGFPEDSYLSQPDSDVQVKLIKTQWFPRRYKQSGPGVAGQFQFNLMDRRNTEAARVIVRQDHPGQEHLNMVVRRLSALGRADVGGLLGFDSHHWSLESVTRKCLQWRRVNHYDIQATPESDPASWPRWKQKWLKIREERKQKAAQEAAGTPGADAMEDNEAGASLESRGVDVREVWGDARDSLEERYAELGLACACPADSTEYSEGVLTEATSARLAEATWD